MSSVERHRQFPSARPGVFIRASLPRFSKSGSGAMASPAIEDQANSIKACAASLLLALSPFRYFQIRSEEHTSELQSRLHLVCRLLLEKKNIQASPTTDPGMLTIPSIFHSRNSHHMQSRLLQPNAHLTSTTPDCGISRYHLLTCVTTHT